MIVPEIYPIENTDADALVCKISAKISKNFCKKIYRRKIGQKWQDIQERQTALTLLVYFLQRNATTAEYEIYNCYYKNRY